MSDRPAFGDYENYQRYWTHLLREALGPNPTAYTTPSPPTVTEPHR
ncbi:hypothetical protein [Nocardia jejuensis]|nr:hypothetical protein [Nocardia jejuensis]